MKRSQTSIVCGVDGSAGCREATRVAAELAGALDARLILVHAAQDPPPFPYGDARESELQRARVVRAGHRLLEDTSCGLDAILRVTLGDPAAALQTVCGEEDAEFLVLGSRGHSPPAASLLGTVAARLASSAVCPVVFVPSGAGERFVARTTRGGSIVCGFDGSPESERALEAAVGLAERLALEPLAIFVDAARSPIDAGPSPVQVLSGDPVHALRERASCRDARLLAVGSRGRGAFRGSLLGSVSEALAAAAPIPVLVVPPTARVCDVLETFAGAAARNGTQRFAI